MKKKITTSKVILFVMIILCIQIVVFCELMMDKYGDLSAMYALIGVPATLVPVIWQFYSKSKAENTKDGIIYDMAMREYENQLNNDDEPVG